jgi:hypothetical protein
MENIRRITMTLAQVRPDDDMDPGSTVP